MPWLENKKSTLRNNLCEGKSQKRLHGFCLYGKQIEGGAHVVEGLQPSFPPFFVYLYFCEFAVQFRICSFLKMFQKALGNLKTILKALIKTTQSLLQRNNASGFSKNFHSCHSFHFISIWSILLFEKILCHSLLSIHKTIF